MSRFLSDLGSRLEGLTPWLVLVVLAVFTYAKFLVAPYVGFTFNASDGRVTAVFASAVPDAPLRPGDRLLRVGSVDWGNFKSDLGQPLFVGVRPGEVVLLRVERDGIPIALDWTYPGFNSEEFAYRLNSEWFLAYLFWLAGAVTVLLLRPKDTLWRLLAAFNFLTAIWLIAGSGPDKSRLLGGALVLRAAMWLSVPVYLHLHWMFPAPLARLPAGGVRALYLAAAGLAVGQAVQLLPPDLYRVGLLLALGGSLLLLVTHTVFRPAHRRAMGLVGLAAMLALLPAVILGVVSMAGPMPAILGGGALLALPGLSFAYLYAAYHRRLGALEVRANRIVSLYVFFILLGTLLVVLLGLAHAWAPTSEAGFVTGVVAALLSAAAALGGYPHVARFVEHRLLGLPLPPTALLTSYTARITTSLDRPGLVRLLSDELLPSLLVRQSALLHYEEAGRVTPLFAMGVRPEDLPGVEALAALEAEAGRVRGDPDGLTRPCAWARLVLPLRLGGRVIGLWLFGRRDPDDYYASTELPTLQAVADQTAIGLAYIVQAGRLRALYQADIDRHERERAALAHELHDEALQCLVQMHMQAGDAGLPPEFEEHYTRAVESLRRTVSGLRPALLDYGLAVALAALADDFDGRAGEAEVGCDVSGPGQRYDPALEQHLFRIVQQACANALRHARARRVSIHGRLAPDRVELAVEDDGIGFELGDGLDLHGLLAQRHFGLAGMYERAALVGVGLQFDSAPGRGTRVRVNWTSASLVVNGDRASADGV